jgi:hypothetical protein
MDWTQPLTQFIVAITPVVTTLVVWGIRKLVPKIPRVALPIIAMLLPVAASWVASLAMGTNFTPIVAALLGAAAVWLREVVNTLQQHQINS